jgi:hypothetical protein
MRPAGGQTATAGSHDGRGDGPRPELQTRITLRPVGSSLPLGFFSFGIGMLLLGCSATGWIPARNSRRSDFC